MESPWPSTPAVHRVVPAFVAPSQRRVVSPSVAGRAAAAVFLLSPWCFSLPHRKLRRCAVRGAICRAAASVQVVHQHRGAFYVRGRQSGKYLGATHDGHVIHDDIPTDFHLFVLVPGMDVFTGYVKLYHLASDRSIFVTQDGLLGCYHGDFEEHWWKMLERDDKGSFSLVNFATEVLLYSNADGRLGTFQGDYFEDQLFFCQPPGCDGPAVTPMEVEGLYGLEDAGFLWEGRQPVYTDAFQVRHYVRDASRNLQGIGEVWRSLAPLSWGSGVDRQLAEMPRPHHWAIEHIPFLKHLAQQGLISESHGRSLELDRCQLITSSGRALTDAAQSLAEAGLGDGDQLTAVALQMKMSAAVKAIALWCYGGDRIVTWGDPRLGGDTSAVVAQLRGVQQVEATSGAFAAIVADGSVVTWGSADYGGDSSEVQDQLRNVQQLQATTRAFAAVLADGSVVTWGRGDCGGDSSAVQSQLQGVRQVEAADFAFAAILADGSVVTWGNPDWGGDSSEVQGQLSGSVQQIRGATYAFAAVLKDGSVAARGDTEEGGSSTEVQDQLRSVQKLQATSSAFAAILADGSVVTWGNPKYGGDSTAVRDQLRNVEQVEGTAGAFAAIVADGSVVAWGSADYGGDSSEVQDQLINVQRLQATTDGAFAALLADRSIVTWGPLDCGGDSSAVQDKLINVQQLGASDAALVAILSDGSVVTWGDPSHAGDSSGVRVRPGAFEEHGDHYKFCELQHVEPCIPLDCLEWEVGKDAAAVQVVGLTLKQLQPTEPSLRHDTNIRHGCRALIADAQRTVHRGKKRKVAMHGWLIGLQHFATILGNNELESLKPSTASAKGVSVLALSARQAVLFPKEVIGRELATRDLTQWLQKLQAASHDAAGIKDLDAPRVALDAEIHVDSLPPAEEELQPKGFIGRAWDQFLGILSFIELPSDPTVLIFGLMLGWPLLQNLFAAGGAAAAPQAAGNPSQIKEGDLVKVEELEVHKEYNGLQGRVLGRVTADGGDVKHRVQLQIGSETKVLAIRERNLRKSPAT
eukprot:s235_g13.t1